MRLIIDPQPPGDADTLAKCAEVWRVESGSRVIGWVGYMETDILTRSVFLWFRANDLRAADARALRKLWAAHGRKWRQIFAGVAPGIPARFAEFFGFVRLGPLEEGYDLYGLRPVLPHGNLCRDLGDRRRNAASRRDAGSRGG